MYGQRLWILIATLVFFATTTFMTIYGKYYSWSDHAGTELEPLFIYAILSALILYIVRSFSYEERNKVLFKIKGTEVRVKVINRLAALSFLSITAFAVWNHKAPHFIFTALAILFAHLEIWTFYKNSVQGNVWRAASLLGLFGFAGGFFFHWYSIGWGESFVALPAIIFVLRDEIVTLITKNKK